MKDKSTTKGPTMKNSITVDGVEYIKAVPSESPIKIVVLQRGWVCVGRYEREGDECRLLDASVIRVWGTTKGLGELAAGPTAKTVLDPAGTVRFHALTTVLLIDCDEAGWAR